MKTKTPKNNTSQWNFLIILTLINNLLENDLIVKHVTNLTADCYNKNNELKFLVQLINNNKIKP